MSWLDSQINRLTALKNMHRKILTLTLLMWRIWWAPNNASKWQLGFNSAFKGLKEEYCLPGCMPCSLLQIYQSSGQSAVSIFHLTWRWWHVCPSKILVNFYQITFHLILEDCILNCNFCENFICHITYRYKVLI